MTITPQLRYVEGERVVQLGGGRRHGTIVAGLWSGYVTVAWDSGRTESMVHIRDIRAEAR